MSKKQLNIGKMYDGDNGNQRKRKLADEDEKNSSEIDNSNIEHSNYLDSSDFHTYSTFQSKIRKRSSLFEKDNIRTSTFIANKTPGPGDESQRPSTSSSDLMSTPTSQRPKFNPTLLHSPFYPSPTMYGGAGAFKMSFLSGLESKPGNSVNTHRSQSGPENIVVKSSNCQDNSMSQTARRIFNLLEQYSSPKDMKRLSYTNNTASSSYINTPAPFLDRSKRNSSHVSLVRSETKPKQGLSRLQELSIPTIPDLIMMRHKRKLMDETTEAARQIASSHSSALSHSPSNYRIRDDTSKRPERNTNVIRTKISRKTGPKVDMEAPAAVVNLPNAILPIQGIKLPTFNIPKIGSFPKLSEKTEIKDTATTRKRSFEFAKPVPVADITKNVVAKNNFVFSRPLSAAMKYDKITESNKVGSTSTLNFKYEPPKNVEAKSKENNKSATGDVNKSIAPLSDSQFKPAGSWSCKDCEVANKFNDIKCTSCGANKPYKGNTERVESIGDYFKNSQHNKPTIGDKINPPMDNTKKTESALLSALSSGDNFQQMGAQPASNSLSKLPTSLPEKSMSNSLQWGNHLPKPGSWSCKECWVSNKAEDIKCVACDTGKTTTDKLSITGNTTNQNILSNPAKSNIFDYPKDSGKSTLIASQFKAAGSWSCNNCWVSNKPNDLKCVACGDGKPIDTPATSEKILLNNVSPLLNNNNKANWECKDCYVSNIDNTLKCVACGGIRYDNELVNSLSKCNNGPISGNFKDIVKQQGSLWECVDCMTRNEHTKIKCVCCNGLKPSARNIPDNSEFSFSTEQNTAFKFGIDKTGESNLLTNNLNTTSNMLPKPGETVTPSGGFKFGIPTSANTTTSFSFGINKDSESKPVVEKTSPESEKPQVVQPVAGFVFGIPTTTAASLTKPAEIVKNVSISSVIPTPIKEISLQENKLPENKKIDLKVDNNNEGKFTGFNTKPAIPSNISQINTTVLTNESTNKPSFIFGTGESSKLKPAEAKEELKSVPDSSSAASAASTASIPSFTFGSANTLSAFKAPDSTTFTFISPTTTASKISPTVPKTLNAFGSDTKVAAPFTFGAPLNNLGTDTKLSEPAKSSGLFNINSSLPKKNETDNPPPPFPTNLGFNFSSNNSNLTLNSTFKSTLPGNIAKTEASPFSIPDSTQPSVSPFSSSIPSIFPNKGSTLFSTPPKPSISQTDGLFKAPGEIGSSGLFNTQQTGLGAGNLPTSNIFGATTQAALPATQAQPIFGMQSSVNQPPSIGFGSQSTGGTVLGGSYKFGNPTQNSNTLGEQRSNLFPQSSGLFGSPQTNSTPGSPSSMFGNSSVPINPPAFGATTSPFGQSSVSVPPLNNAFNFGSTASVPSVFSFGQSAAPPNPNATFQFGPNANAAPAFNPEIQSQFSFNVGASPNAFRSSQAGSTLAARKVKRATRRITPR